MKPNHTRPNFHACYKIQEEFLPNLTKLYLNFTFGWVEPCGFIVLTRDSKLRDVVRAKWVPKETPIALPYGIWVEPCGFGLCGFAKKRWYFLIVLALPWKQHTDSRTSPAALSFCFFLGSCGSPPVRGSLDSLEAFPLITNSKSLKRQ